MHMRNPLFGLLLLILFVAPLASLAQTEPKVYLVDTGSRVDESYDASEVSHRTVNRILTEQVSLALEEFDSTGIPTDQDQTTALAIRLLSVYAYEDLAEKLEFLRSIRVYEADFDNVRPTDYCIVRLWKGSGGSYDLTAFVRDDSTVMVERLSGAFRPIQNVSEPLLAFSMRGNADRSCIGLSDSLSRYFAPQGDIDHDGIDELVVVTGIPTGEYTMAEYMPFPEVYKWQPSVQLRERRFVESSCSVRGSFFETYIKQLYDRYRACLPEQASTLDHFDWYSTVMAELDLRCE
jgi:hypothetical protein